jgi:hypothetical protein
MRSTRKLSRGILVVLIVGVAVVGAACRREDPRVRNLAVGISKDSVYAVMGGPTLDTPNAYLVKGQYIEALLYRREGVGGPRDSLSRRDLTPVILINGSLAGWGWSFWDSVAGANGIPVPR